jgi:catechol 2,3-dioxygenase-like lactoylglutathione lyase family enzyme
VKLERVYETVLYARDVAEASGFYVDVLGLRAVEEPDELASAFRLPDGGILLLFDPDRSSAQGRRVPSHGTTGASHVAFGVAAGELEWWAAKIRAGGIEIEREIDWDGGRSFYVRDPAGNSVELVDGDIWPP